MFPSPSGRVTVRQHSDHVSISIRAARDWTVVLCSVFLVFWVIFPLLFVLDHFLSDGSGLAPRAGLQPFEFFWSFCWLVSISFFVWRIAWGLDGVDSILLSATELRLSSTLFGISIRRSVVPTSEVRNLRFLPSRWVGRTYVRSKITYEDARGMARLAAGLEEPEALAVMDVMLAVYPFPKVKSRYTTP